MSRPETQGSGGHGQTLESWDQGEKIPFQVEK